MGLTSSKLSASTLDNTSPEAPEHPVFSHEKNSDALDIAADDDNPSPGLQHRDLSMFDQSGTEPHEESLHHFNKDTVCSLPQTAAKEADHGAEEDGIADTPQGEGTAEDLNADDDSQEENEEGTEQGNEEGDEGSTEDEEEDDEEKPYPGVWEQSQIYKNQHSNYISIPDFKPHPDQLSISLTIAIPSMFRKDQPPDLLSLVALDRIAKHSSLPFTPAVFRNGYKRFLADPREIARFIIRIGRAYDVSGADTIPNHSQWVLLSLIKLASTPAPMHYARLAGKFEAPPNCRERLIEMLKYMETFIKIYGCEYEERRVRGVMVCLARQFVEEGIGEGFRVDKIRRGIIADGGRNLEEEEGTIADLEAMCSAHDAESHTVFEPQDKLGEQGDTTIISIESTYSDLQRSSPINNNRMNQDEMDESDGAVFLGIVECQNSDNTTDMASDADVDQSVEEEFEEDLGAVGNGNVLLGHRTQSEADPMESPYHGQRRGGFSASMINSSLHRFREGRQPIIDVDTLTETGVSMSSQHPTQGEIEPANGNNTTRHDMIREHHPHQANHQKTYLPGKHFYPNTSSPQDPNPTGPISKYRATIDLSTNNRRLPRKTITCNQPCQFSLRPHLWLSPACTSQTTKRSEESSKQTPKTNGLWQHAHRSLAAGDTGQPALPGSREARWVLNSKSGLKLRGGGVDKEGSVQQGINEQFSEEMDDEAEEAFVTSTNPTHSSLRSFSSPALEPASPPSRNHSPVLLLLLPPSPSHPPPTHPSPNIQPPDPTPLKRSNLPLNPLTLNTDALSLPGKKRREEEEEAAPSARSGNSMAL